MRNRAKEWLYLALKILPVVIVSVALIKYIVILGQQVEVNTSAIGSIKGTKKEWDTKYYNILKRLGVIETNMGNYVTKVYFWDDNKIVKSDIMWSMDRIYVLQGRVSMNTGEIKGEHSK